MVCEITDFISEFAKKIPSSEDEQFIFSSNTLPQIPESLSTNQIIVGKSYHSYQSYTNSKVDFISFQAHKEIYKYLGLLILSKVFHETPLEVNIKLTHQSSMVKKIVLDYEHPTDENTSSGYYSKPYKFIYIPSDLISRHPFVYYKKHLLPLFNLTNETDCIATDEDWNNRNTIRCAGLDRGNVLFAELLLNFSRPQEQLNELILEGELGYQSVGTGSAEVSLYLPGSLGWDGYL